MCPFIDPVGHNGDPFIIVIKARDGKEFFTAALLEILLGTHGDLFEGLKAVGYKCGRNYSQVLFRWQAFY